MLIPNRNASTTAYRYGFQGQEKDDEMKGEGNYLNFKYRGYDPRVGRFFNTDPLEGDYPFYTPYQFSGNRVIDSRELEGLEQEYYMLKINTETGESKLTHRTDMTKETGFFSTDTKNVLVYNQNKQVLATYTFRKPFAIENRDTALYGNWYEEFDTFAEDPVKAIASGDYDTNEDISQEFLTTIMLAVISKRIASKRSPKVTTKGGLVTPKPKPAQVNKRHYLSSDAIGKSKKTKPSTVGPKEIIDADIKAYNKGNFKKVKGGNVEINGNTYGLKNEGSTLYPIKGDKFINLTQGQIKAIQLHKTVPAQNLNKALKGAGVSTKDSNFAKEFISKY